MSPSTPTPPDTEIDSDADAAQAPAVPYWTPGKVLAGVLMMVVAFGLVAVVQWDDVTRIMQGNEQSALAQRAGFHPQSPADTFDLSNLQLPKEKLRSGGPPKDGIPSLTDPKTAPVSDADFMRPNDRVVGVTVNGETRAYPIKVLNWHECYNDTLGGVPIAVVFCPLCDSVTVVDRRLNGKTYEFGISGLLSNSNVLLYDRQDDALWSQAGLIAISGPNAGKSLKHLDGWSITTFDNWRRAQPGSTVATLDTGHYSPERYNSVAYASYFATDELMFPVEPRDDRFPNKYPIIGVQVGQTAKAYPVDAVAAAPGGRIQDTIDGQPIVLEAAGDESSLRVVESPDGAQVIHTFWFAWHAFHPQTRVYSGTTAE